MAFEDNGLGCQCMAVYCTWLDGELKILLKPSLPVKSDCVLYNVAIPPLEHIVRYIWLATFYTLCMCEE